MRPIIVLVGRQNVGKSTLFNQLTRSRDALVADVPGLTRDRKYGVAWLGRRQCWVIDTGGLGGTGDALEASVAEQTQLAIEAAGVVVLVMDAREGLTVADELIARQLKKSGKPLLAVINKIDGMDAEQASAEFYSLGIAPSVSIAAAHGRGLAELSAVITEYLSAEGAATDELDLAAGIRIALVGRPNVGKSTLANRLLGEQRVLTAPKPGTTRDSIAMPYERGAYRYMLIDTAGMRRRSRIKEAVEKFSVVKSMQAIEAAHVVIAVLDARQGIAEQDASLLGLILESGRALVIAVNKWDGLSHYDKNRARRELDRRLSFLEFAERHPISALHGSGVGKLMDSVQRAYCSSIISVPTPELTRLLEGAVKDHQPPQVSGRRIRLRYAHQGGSSPPTFVIHGNQTAKLPSAYKRYLMNYFRKALTLTGTPVRLVFKTGENPYASHTAPLAKRRNERPRRASRRTG
jgi:GTP-binding protein